MLEQPDVTEFMVVAPIEKRVALLRSKERFEGFLARRFPGHTFRLARLSPIDDEPELLSIGEEIEFLPIPIMNWISPDGDSIMCKRVPVWKLMEIEAACREFDPTNLRLVA